MRAHGRITQDELDRLKDGVEIEGVRYGPVEAKLDSVQGGNVWLTLGLREGKNREVRRILTTFGLEVNRLIRISYGPFQLLDLKPGEAELVAPRMPADQLGTRLANDFGLFDAEPEHKARRRARPPRSRAATQRIVAGRYRGGRWWRSRSEATRPTSDRVREAVFNIPPTACPASR